eukprot:3291185-Ditylum_brightwellii.AAC.1
MTQFTRPEIQNVVRECSKLASFPTKKAIKAMKRIMWHCVYTKKQGLVLKPDVQWNGRRGFKFRIKGVSNSEYAKDKMRKSVNGWSIFLCNALILYKSKMMPIIALLVTEAE